jgi:hypothetical protein
MRKRTTWMMFLLTLLLGGSYVWYNGVPLMGETGRSAAANVLRMDPARVTQLVVQSDALQVICVRDNGGWRIEDPVGLRANQAVIDRLLAGLGSLSLDAPVVAADESVEPLQLDEYGLLRPRRRIRWQDALGAQSLLLGRATPMGSMLYARFDGSDNVYTLPLGVLEWIPEQLDAWRDRVLFHGDPDTVNRVEIRRPGGRVLLVRAEDGAWRLQQPVSGTADSLAVQRWLAAVHAWRVVGFEADQVGDASVYGLGEEATRVTLWNRVGNQEQQVWLGSPIEARSQQLYARRNGSPAVLSVSTSVLEQVSIPTYAFRQRALLAMQPAEVESIRLESGSARVVLERDAVGEWLVLEPTVRPADNARVQALLEAWTAAQIDRFIDQPEAATDETAMTADRAAMRLTFQPRGGRTATVLDIDLTPDTNGLIRVRKAEETNIYEVTQEVLQRTASEPQYYWDRRVFSVPQSAMRWLEIRGPDGEALLRFDDPSGMMLETDLAAMVDTQAVDSVLAEFDPLVAEAFTGNDPSVQAASGLAEPIWSWSLRFDGVDGVGQVLLVGEADANGRRYARTRGDRSIFLLDATQSDLFTRFPLILPPAEEEPEAVESATEPPMINR